MHIIGKTCERGIMKRYILYSILVLIILVGLFWGLTAANIITLGIQREATQHSQPYTETKVSLLYSLYNDWLELDAEIAEFKVLGETDIVKAKQSQQKALIRQMKEEANYIPDGEVPAEIKSFLRRH